MIALRPAALDVSHDLRRARREIEAALPGDDAHETHRATMLQFIAAHPDALLRSSHTGHLTSSAVVVDATAQQVLLLEHRKLARWLQPGGHADGEANLAASARREASEETGIEGLTVFGPAIDLDIHGIRSADEPPHDHLDVRYLVMAPAGAEVRINHESTAQRWVREADLDLFDPDPGLRRLVHRGLELAATLLG